MSKKSDNLTHMDALWLAYVSNDPELYRMEQRRRARAYDKVLRAYRSGERRRKARELANMIAVCALGAVVFVLMCAMF